MYQGGPRRAARYRPYLHGRRPDDDGAGRLAHDGLSDPRREAVLWRHLLSAGGPLWQAGITQGFGGRNRRVAEPSRRDRGTGGLNRHFHTRFGYAAASIGSDHRRSVQPGIPEAAAGL